MPIFPTVSSSSLYIKKMKFKKKLKKNFALIMRVFFFKKKRSLCSLSAFSSSFPLFIHLLIQQVLDLYCGFCSFPFMFYILPFINQVFFFIDDNFSSSGLEINGSNIFLHFVIPLSVAIVIDNLLIPNWLIHHCYNKKKIGQRRKFRSYLERKI